MNSEATKLDQNLKRIDEMNFHLKDWDHQLMEKVKVDFTYYSNKIEGNAVTYGETIGILKNGIIPQNRSLQDVFSIENHKKFIDKLFKSYADDLSVEYIKDLHKSYMESIFQWAEGTGDNYSPGVLKWAANGTVRPNGSFKEYMNEKQTPAALHDLCESVNDQLKSKSEHPVIIASTFHQRFIGEIHPFVDGNGRLGRMLSNQVLMKGGVTPATFELKNDSRMDYLRMMDSTSTSYPDTMKKSHLYFSDMVMKTMNLKVSRNRSQQLEM